MRHGHETCKIVDWQFSQSQAEKLGQDVTKKYKNILIHITKQIRKHEHKSPGNFKSHEKSNYP